MSELWQGVLIGAAVSIPIGILVNFMHKSLDEKWKMRSTRSAERNKERSLRITKQASELHADAAKYSIYLAESSVSATQSLTRALLALSVAVGLAYITFLVPNLFAQGILAMAFFFALVMAVGYGWGGLSRGSAVRVIVARVQALGRPKRKFTLLEEDQKDD